MSDQGRDQTSIIAAGTKIVGEITGAPPIEIWGTLDGTATTEKALTVRSGGAVHGNVEAQEVAIEGELEGKAQAHNRIHLRNGCKVTAELKTSSLSIDDGAFFEGSVEMRTGKNAS
ncbi:MAG: polymer-forming cytoskeletal protein [Acidobacteriota bacterium]